MKTNEIDILLQNTQSPCLSIIVSTDPANRKKNYETVKKSVQKAKAILRTRPIDAAAKENLTTRLSGIITDIPENHAQGLGIFISPAQSIVVEFPFAVKPAVSLGNTFEIRDLLYLKQYTTPYWIMALTRKGVRLFKGVINELEEIKDQNFPVPFEDRFEYEHASLANNSSNSLKSFEKEKNEISEIRHKAIFRLAEERIKAYLAAKSKLFLAGTQRMIGVFTKGTTLAKYIAGKVTGSYNNANLEDLSQRAWDIYMKQCREQIANEIKTLPEKENGRVAEGLKQAWTAAMEGRGLTLLVEKDLHHRGYRKDEPGKLHLQPPTKPYTIIPDAVDNLIEVVRAKNGKVIFTENNQLKQFDHLALLLRY